MLISYRRTINTEYSKYRKYIIKDDIIRDDKCRLCHSNAEQLNTLYASSRLESTEYLRRHHNIAKIVYQTMCKSIKNISELSPYYRYKS